MVYILMMDRLCLFVKESDKDDYDENKAVDIERIIQRWRMMLINLIDPLTNIRLCHQIILFALLLG